MSDAAPAPMEEEWLRLAEAMVFASAGPVTPRALGQILPESADPDMVIAALRDRYAGRGVELVEAAGGVMFRTAADLAPRLRKVVEIPRRLPRAAMETLAIIAYHQPVTRPEIEEIRGTSLSQQTLDALLEAGLIAPKGRRECTGTADALGHHDGISRAVWPDGPARPAAAGGSASGTSQPGGLRLIATFSTSRGFIGGREGGIGLHDVHRPRVSAGRLSC